MAEKDEILQAKQRELAEAQQQLTQQVSCVHVQCMCTFLYIQMCIHECTYVCVLYRERLSGESSS